MVHESTQFLAAFGRACDNPCANMRPVTPALSEHADTGHKDLVGRLSTANADALAENLIENALLFRWRWDNDFRPIHT